MANTALAYVLWFVGSWFGLHHLYLRRPGAAFVSLVTLNGWGVVWFKDFLAIPQLVEQANGGPEYEEKLRVARKFNTKPPLSLLAAVVQIFVATEFGSIAGCLLPKGIHAMAYEVMFALGAAFGITFTGSAIDAHTTGSFLWAFTAIVIVVVPSFIQYDFDYEDEDYRSSRTAGIVFGELAYLMTRCWSADAVEISEKLEATAAQSTAAQEPKKTKKTLSIWKTLLTYWTLLGLFFASGLVALGFHGTIHQEINGEIVDTPFFEACDNFFKSEAFQTFASTLYDLYAGTGEDEHFYDRWERVNANMDLSGRFRAFKVLGLPRNATAKDIKSAYRRLVLQWHPDKYAGDDKDEANEKFLEIQEAYEKLTGSNQQQEEEDAESARDEL